LSAFQFYFTALNPPNSKTCRHQESQKQEKDQTEEISFSKFNAQLRREKILENMSPEEKKLFLQSSGYTSPETLEHDDEFVIYTNFCTTLLLLALSSSLIYYLVTNTLPSLSFRLDL
jgi:hypothetical protein